MTTGYLSLGSNIGDRGGNIARATAALRARGVQVTRESSLYETEPVEFREQAWFLNCVVEIQTDLTAELLMSLLLEIERELGRERRIPKGPRLIDIDILLFGAEVSRDQGLEIPHPRMADRRFVLVPFAEITPEAKDPRSGKTVAELLNETTDPNQVNRWSGGKTRIDG